MAITIDIQYREENQEAFSKLKPTKQVWLYSRSDKGKKNKG